jgi:hypothetical protein
LCWPPPNSQMVGKPSLGIMSGLSMTRAELSIVRNGPAAEALCVPEAETK